MKKYLYIAIALLIILVGWQYAEADIYGSSLKAYWTMDGKSISGTSLTDYSGNSNTGTLVGSPTQTYGKIGQSLNFSSASSQYVTIGSAGLGNGSATFSAWVTFPTAGVSLNTIVSNGNYFMYYNGNLFNFRYDTTGAQLLGTTHTYTTTNTWYHVVGVYDTSVGANGTEYIYVNGMQDGSRACTANPNGTNNTQLSIGSRQSLATQYYNGRIDDVRIYNRALSAGEVAALYYQGITTHFYGL